MKYTKNINKFVALIGVTSFMLAASILIDSRRNKTIKQNKKESN